MVCAKGRVLSVEDLPDELRERCRHRRESAPAITSGESGAETSPADTAGGGDEVGERGDLLRALEACRWSRKDAATALGIDRTTLWRRMKRLGVV